MFLQGGSSTTNIQSSIMASKKICAKPSLKASLQLGDIDLEAEKSRGTETAHTKWRFIMGNYGKIIGKYVKIWGNHRKVCENIGKS